MEIAVYQTKLPCVLLIDEHGDDRHTVYIDVSRWSLA